jgi:two-component system response regulator YesN
MIKVLVVEDDKLARKGLIHAMPWEDFGMSVVGEAGTGQAALDILASREVDLMLTDFAMPGMSGGELMRIARRRFPRLLCAVLTFHQELEYAQEAIRLGAIDYIAKVQLEKEGFDEVLGRIRDRFVQEREQAASARSQGGQTDCFAADIAYALLSIEGGAGPEGLGRLLEGLGEASVEVEGGFRLWEPREVPATAGQASPSASAALAKVKRAVEASSGWTLVELSGLTGEGRSRTLGAVRRYRETDFFYDQDRRRTFLPKSLAELEAPPPPASEAAVAELERRLLACEWVFDDQGFGLLRSELASARLPLNKLLRLLVELEGEWNRIFWPIASRRAKMPEAFKSWQAVEAWLGELRDSAFAGNVRLSYAAGVVQGVMRAVKMVDEELGGPLFAVDVARRVNMSRGYFCRCFKDIVGKPFNDYLRWARVEKAKVLLLHTDAQIHQIAEQVGYADEKYFSTVFREQAGLLPSGFRLAAREGRRPSSAG